jgi:hypothetical protein
MICNRLTTQPNFPVPDEFYERLIEAHSDLSTEQSHAMNAALVLLLSNHIGDLDIVSDAFAKARTSVQSMA